jgi:hypothetical protein
MADIKVTGLAAETAPISTDLVMLVDDPTGSAVSKKLELSNLSKGLTLPVQQVTSTTYTCVITDANNFIRFKNNSAQTITIPPNSSVAFPSGTVITGFQEGNGTVTIAAGAGVTIVSLGSNLDISGKYGVIKLIKIITNGWVLWGDLA